MLAAKILEIIEGYSTDFISNLLEILEKRSCLLLYLEKPSKTL